MNKSEINLAINVAIRNRGIAQENLIKATQDLHTLYALRQEKKKKGLIKLYINGETKWQ